MTNPLITAAWEAIGYHSAQIAETGKQAPGEKILAAMKAVEDELAAQAQQIAQARADAARAKVLHETIIAAARRSMDEGEDALDTINVPSHHAAALSLALDDYDAFMKEKTP